MELSQEMETCVLVGVWVQVLYKSESSYCTLMIYTLQCA